MYQIIIGLYLLYNAKNNFQKLFSLGYGINSFTKLNWVLLILSIFMIPLGILMLIKGYKDIKSRKEQEQADIDEINKKKENLYAEYNDEIDINDIDDSASRFDT